MNAPADLIRLTQFSHGGGCGCKIAPAVLSEILAKTPIRGLPKDLLVGIESSDDAAVYRLNDEQAIKRYTAARSEEHTSELQSLTNLVCRLLLEKKKKK